MSLLMHARTGWPVLLLYLVCAPLWAQGDSGGVGVIEEVLVTAQKRTQRNVDVGINVSALSADSMTNLRIEQVRDISAYIPNTNVKEQVPGAIPVVTIRGVGLEDFSTTNSPAAGIYVDEVSLSSLALMSFDLYDMARIEVLKGPQGTLYGRNSTAGAVNLVTARPSEAQEGYLKLSYGNYDAIDAEAMFNVPLGESLALRIAGKSIRQDGFWISRFAADEQPGASGLPGIARVPGVTDGLEGDHQGSSRRDLGERDIRSGRLQLHWDINGSVQANYKVEHLRQRSELGQPEFFGQSCVPGSAPHDPDNCTDLHGYTDTDRDPYEGDWSGEFPYHIDQTSHTLTLNADLDWAQLTWVGGYIDFERTFHIDADGTPRDGLNFVQADEVQQQSHELRLAGDAQLPAWLGERSVDWLAGVFWSSDDVEIYNEGSNQELFPPTLFPIPGLDQLATLITSDQATESQALFVNADWHLSDRLTLVTGARYTEEERDYRGGSEWSLELPGLFNTTYTDTRITDSNWSWRVGLNYSPSENSLLYASASRGNKSGGFFAGLTSSQRQLEPYRPEELTAYELGFKRQGAVTLNASLFYYDYKDVQTFLRAPPATVQFIGNVSEARVYGADLDLLWRPLDGLTIQAGIGLLDTELGAFVGPNGDTIAKGNELPNAPSKTANLLLRYELPLRNNGLITGWQVDTHFADSMYKDATNDPLISSDSYSIVNARVSLFPERRNWELGFWGKNLSDETYVVQGANLGGFAMGNRNYNAPRTYGVEMIYHFF